MTNIAVSKDSSLAGLRTLPMPRPDQELYQKVMQAGFEQFPNRLENYRRYQTSERGEYLDYLPIKLDVENVSRCNFRCTMCQVSEWPKQQRAADMDLLQFKQLLDNQPGLVEIKLQGMGEPLLAASDFIEMIKYARQRHLWVRSTVNGSLLHIKDNYRKLIDSDICEIQVSIDGATKDVYELIRVGGKFNMVTRNCKLLNEYAYASNRMRTRMWCVVQRDNYKQLEKFPELAAELGFKRLTLSLDLNDWGQDAWRERNDPDDVHRELDIERAHALITESDKLGIQTTFWFIDEKYKLGTASKLCPWPFERAYISSDMRVVPCCMIANPTIADMGDARHLEDVWNSDEMMSFRRSHLSGQIPKFCSTCYAANED